MEQVCHRCGATVHESDPFCPQCGAPQLRYEAPEEPTTAPSNIPARHFAMRSPNGIRWRDGVRVAALIAIPTGLLSSRLGLEGIWALWLIAGGMVVASMYRKRTGTLLTGRMGWRIGALLGLFTAVIATAADGISLVIQRFALHQGAMLDSRYRDAMQLMTKMYGDLFANSSPDVVAAVTKMQHFYLTPAGAATVALSGAAEAAVFMLIFAGLGGALGARLGAKSAHASTH
ncbi:MAG: hypothetical protein ACRD3F_08020 [Acidobacteriaceae bacterium]